MPCCVSLCWVGCLLLHYNTEMLYKITVTPVFACYFQLRTSKRRLKRRFPDCLCFFRCKSIHRAQCVIGVCGKRYAFLTIWVLSLRHIHPSNPRQSRACLSWHVLAHTSAHTLALVRARIGSPSVKRLPMSRPFVFAPWPDLAWRPRSCFSFLVELRRLRSSVCAVA